ncbi:MAG: respiratory nitrate reductase subunit gamma [Ignavibacteriota bacterium]|nr:MAG: respiratory nitrate reductase subunit gamma [Chlorobiota bacterium]MBL1121891.1 respiratory nitrate reductase subunit gamma [Ignavibacteriota bacterium]MCE7855551.1 respiratory nitrate reductase subunit gamma [Ignavibacteria bacterium CHB3]GJQ41455.1 MAG: respiratory nitrate reductase subunit gamma [Ignavibacteriaceae bacterium]QKJ96810.1 MAG: respiratory nitrate reductase subunit gamma [Ignavibacteriota bacterium]
MNILYNFLFIALPYVAITVFLIGTVYRYRGTKFKFSSLSSEFLEGKKLFFGSVPFHYGIIFLFFGHLVAFLLPREVLLWNDQPVRLLILEVSAFIFGISAFVGMFLLIIRRKTHPRIQMVSTKMDLIIEILILSQIFLGLWIAYGYRWGSSWFAAVLSPYLMSIFTLDPQITAVTNLPLVIQLHIAIAFLIVLLIPFSRLVHLLVPPLSYLWRPYQKVIWYWNRKKIRNPRSIWAVTKPKNN